MELILSFSLGTKLSLEQRGLIQRINFTATREDTKRILTGKCLLISNESDGGVVLLLVAVLLVVVVVVVMVVVVVV